MQSQKEAVFSAITSVLAEKGVSFEVGSNVSPIMTKEYRGLVNAILVEGFKSGDIPLDKQFDEAGLKAYASSLLSNWIRKDKRLNGGVAYVAKNPGSRTGSGDESLKAMRTLLKTLTPGTEDYAEVQSHIDERTATLKASKVKSITFNRDALPEALRAKFSA